MPGTTTETADATVIIQDAASMLLTVHGERGNSYQKISDQALMAMIKRASGVLPGQAVQIKIAISANS